MLLQIEMISKTYLRRLQYYYNTGYMFWILASY
jgi:hypothetical protein